jgi:hypothetical protein
VRTRRKRVSPATGKRRGTASYRGRWGSTEMKNEILTWNNGLLDRDTIHWCTRDAADRSYDPSRVWQPHGLEHTKIPTSPNSIYSTAS